MGYNQRVQERSISSLTLDELILQKVEYYFRIIYIKPFTYRFARGLARRAGLLHRNGGAFTTIPRKQRQRIAIYGLLSETSGITTIIIATTTLTIMDWVAIDFDNGYIWFGTWNGSLDTWDGDPARHRSDLYVHAEYWLLPSPRRRSSYTGFLCTAMVELGCSRDYMRAACAFWVSALG